MCALPPPFVFLLLSKAIFPFSPGNVANADWLSTGDDMKVLDAKMATPTNRRLHAAALIAIGSADNCDGAITSSIIRQTKKLDKGKH
jgi:hypothetical protein